MSHYKDAKLVLSSDFSCESYNARYLRILLMALSRITRPVDLYIVNSKDNRIQFLVDSFSKEIKKLEEEIKLYSRIKGCKMYELVFDTTPKY